MLNVRAVSHAYTDLGFSADSCPTEHSLLTAAFIMSKLSMAAIAVLLVSVMFIGAQSRKTLGTVDVATIEAMEHQRILAELEEVHQLRERMLQQGKVVDVFVPIRCPISPCCWRAQATAGVQAASEASTVAVCACIKHLKAASFKQRALP